MKSKYVRFFSSVCAAVFLIAALSVSAFAAKSIEEQMAENSAAWWVAHNAGDTATCEALHEANVKLAAQAAGKTGTATYNEEGTWNITTSTGKKITSSDGGSDGKNETVTYTTTQRNGRTNAVSTQTYTDEAIAAYLRSGGTNSGLVTSYNNAGGSVSVADRYGSNTARTSADSEVAVVKALLGLTNAQAAQLKADLEASKQAYESANNAYRAALARGDASAAAAAKSRMDAAHAAAEATRSAYNYTGDSSNYDDGGYYSGGGRTPGASDGGGFYVTEVRVTFKITATATAGGTISPGSEVNVARGGSATFTIRPEANARLVRVLVDGQNVGARTSYTFSNVNEAHTIHAEFAKNSYSITASAGTGGVISPAGAQSIAYNGSITYRISPYSGYQISQVLVDGNNVGAVNSYTFRNVTDNHSIQATFTRNNCTISSSASAGGMISPSGSISITSGSSITYSITPYAGYHISQVLVDGYNVGAVGSYLFSNVNGDHTIQANFTRDSYTITANASGNGIISPAGATSVTYGSSITYRISPNMGWRISDVVVDGRSVGAVSSYTFSSITAGHTITARFDQQTYSITASASTGGSISPTGSRTVTYGSGLTYRITPNTGWKISDVVVDGRSIGAMSSYTFSSITAGHTITAKFDRLTYSITASAGAGGTISPSGTSTVSYGDSLTYTFIPSTDYEIDRVTVDGQNKGRIGSYTFTNVQGGHSISVSFRVKAVVDVSAPTVTDSTGVSLSGASIKSGYGIALNVPVTARGVTDIQVILAYDFGSGRKTIQLEAGGSGYTLPVNSASPTGSRVIYIPVETADGTYTLTVTVTAKDADGQTLTATAASAVTVHGNMYEDDFTGDA